MLVVSGEWLEKSPKRRQELGVSVYLLALTQEGNEVKGSDIDRRPQEAGASSPGVRQASRGGLQPLKRLFVSATHTYEAVSSD